MPEKCKRRPAGPGRRFSISFEPETVGKAKESLPLGTETLCSPGYWIYQPQIMLYARFIIAITTSGLEERGDLSAPCCRADRLHGVTCFEFDGSGQFLW